jgi:hypothetical protein
MVWNERIPERFPEARVRTRAAHPDESKDKPIGAADA